MLTTVIFDLGEVFLRGSDGVEYILEPLLKVSAPKIHQKIENEDLVLLQNGKITENEYWQRIIKNEHWGVKVETLKKAMRSNFGEIEGTRRIIESLREKGYKLGLLSVLGKEWAKYSNRKFCYHKLFHSILYSFQAGISKPSKKVYEMILMELKSQPEECVFIDDTLSNLTPAEKMGMKTIHFLNSKQLRHELIALGFIVN